jgi:ABC-type sugar transport system ATPase subunit
MSAYKLADKLDEYNKDGMPVLVISQAVDVLRQQADRIRDLEMGNDMGEIADLLQHQADLIAFLEKALDSSIKLNKAQSERTHERTIR